MSVQPTLLFAGVFAGFVASIYAYVGWILTRRVVSSAEARLAWQLFIVWWYSLAALTAIGGLLNLFGAFGLTDLPLYLTVSYVNILLVCIALWGLLYYLFYLFTGSKRIFMPLTTFYIIYYILLIYYITASVPDVIHIGRWETTIGYRSPITGVFFQLMLILLVFPQIIGSVAYLTLYFQVRDVTQKYRILLVSLSIIIWFGSAFAASLGGLGEEDWWQITSRFIGLAAAFTILRAYLPPLWLQKRYGIASIDAQVGK